MRQLSWCIATVLSLVVSAYAISGPDFTGQWQLDLEASDKLDDIATLQGMSWMEYKIFENMPVTQTIHQSENRITIIIDSLIKKRTEIIVPDGSVEEKKNEKGYLMQVRSFWAEDRSALLTWIETVTADKKPVKIVIRRSLSPDGQTMIQDIGVTTETGEGPNAKRIFRKINDSKNN
ncbi:MAG: hypothetical protein AB7S77_18130 [Desulfatirhabdiaceae bacterium]